MKTYKNKQQGYTLIEILVSLSISLILCGLLINIFFSVIKNTTKANQYLTISYERILKDDFIRTWSTNIKIPYWSLTDKIIDDKINELKKHSYFKNKILQIEYLYDKYKYKKGIKITYLLSDESIQTTASLFSSFSVVANEEK